MDDMTSHHQPDSCALPVAGLPDNSGTLIQLVVGTTVSDTPSTSKQCAAHLAEVAGQEA
jgi:hypothetical protein